MLLSCHKHANCVKLHCVYQCRQQCVKGDSVGRTCWKTRCGTVWMNLIWTTSWKFVMGLNINAFISMRLCGTGMHRKRDDKQNCLLCLKVVPVNDVTVTVLLLVSWFMMLIAHRWLCNVHCVVILYWSDNNGHLSMLVMIYIKFELNVSVVYSNSTVGIGNGRSGSALS